MKITFTPEQVEHLTGALTTHRQVMEDEMIRAHGTDPKRFAFYEDRVKRVDGLLTLIPKKEPVPADEDEYEDEDA